MVFMLIMMTYVSAADYDNDDDKENVLATVTAKRKK